MLVAPLLMYAEVNPKETQAKSNIETADDTMNMNVVGLAH